MTKKTPQKEPSPSLNLVAPLTLLLFAIMTVALTLALSITRAPAAQVGTQGYDNPNSRAQLDGSSPDLLEVLLPEKTLTLKRETLDAWRTAIPGVFEVRPENSLIQYIYDQIGVSHPWSSYDSQSLVKGHKFSDSELGEWMLESLGTLEQQPQDAELEIVDGRAVSFQPHSDGYIALAKSGVRALQDSILSEQTTLTLPLETRSADVKLGDLNNLGIKELVAVGQSDFSGSSSARINNIRVGAANYNGIILEPGEEFSFNQYLGPVDAAHGFLPELVIKPEGATPEFGGGLCQVSTTAFRAAFFGGLPITQRRNHSYAVHYYEWIADDVPRAVGLDATIYAPYQDMKFVNDTPGSLLVWTRIEGRRLYFDFYGTPDNRVVTVDGPHPFDKRPSGAVKSTVSRSVAKNGTTTEITLNSNYIPPKIAEQTFELPPPPPTIGPEPEPSIVN